MLVFYEVLDGTEQRLMELMRTNKIERQWLTVLTTAPHVALVIGVGVSGFQELLACELTFTGPGRVIKTATQCCHSVFRCVGTQISLHPSHVPLGDHPDEGFCWRRF